MPKLMSFIDIGSAMSDLSIRNKTGGRLKFILFYTIFLMAFSASAGDALNCRGDLEDGYQVNLCSKVIDTNKLQTINCLKEIEDSYKLNLCQNAKKPNGTLDCTAELQDGFEVNLCKSVPVPNSVVYINCLTDLKDSYQLNLCIKVNVKEQSFLHKRL